MFKITYLFFCIVAGILPEESRETAEVILKLNDLLDVLNSRSKYDQCTWKRAISCNKPATEEHHVRLLKEADEWLGRWVVGDGSVRIDSIGGLRQTIRGVQAIWEVCKENGSTALCTRRLNQDGVENLFGVIRQRGGDRDHPDPTQFRHAYRHVLVNNLMTPPESANCEADGDNLIAALREVLPHSERSRQSQEEAAPIPERPLPVFVDPVTENCVGYVAGYLVCKHCECEGCRKVLSKESNVAAIASETLAALKSHTSITSMDVGSLHLPTPDFLSFVMRCYVVFNQNASSLLLRHGICRALVALVMQSESAKALKDRLCHPGVLAKIASTYMRLMLHPL
ncbi:Transposable element P transposase [Amphibalanus amphitrite]|nr:Transposable element P transposase [Amphibalanus amphitrite]